MKLSSPTKSIIKSINFTNERTFSKTSDFKKLVAQRVAEKYASKRDGLNKFVINDIIKNRQTHITSIFKEYLVYDEPIEFLKRNYNMDDIKLKIPKLTEFHSAYFKVFPNYILVPEKHYMYKNIERKQRVIDDQQYIVMMNQNKYEYSRPSYSNLFNDSYMKHISTFRSNFHKEDANVHKPDLFNLFKPRRQSI